MSVCVLDNSNAFTNTPIASGTGYIYVPYSLVSSYKTATNWTYFSSQISAIAGSEDWEIPEVKLITFTIDGTEYQAEEGMTWAEWCTLEDDFFISSTDNKVKASFNNWSGFTVSGVTSTDIIQNGVIYGIEDSWTTIG